MRNRERKLVMLRLIIILGIQYKHVLLDHEVKKVALIIQPLYYCDKSLLLFSPMNCSANNNILY